MYAVRLEPENVQSWHERNVDAPEVSTEDGLRSIGYGVAHGVLQVGERYLGIRKPRSGRDMRESRR